MKHSRLYGVICFILVAAMLLCGCGGNNDTDKQDQTETKNAAVSSTASATSAAITTTTAAASAAMNVDYQKIASEMQEKADVFTKGKSRDNFKFAVMDNGEIVISGSSGNFVNEKTIYDIASVSKVMAVCAVMKLVDAGKVGLDEPVITYLPEFTMQDQRYKQITVRMLMNHSSGLMGNTVGGGWRLGAFEDTAYHDDFLNKLSTQRLRSDPGEYSVYCNDGFTLLEFICEKLSGKTYAQYLRDEILEPLGMNQTFSPLEKFDTSVIAISDFGGIGDLPALTTDAAQGGMFSSAEDLCRFGKTFTNNGSGILTAASVQAMAEQEYKRGVWCEDGENTMNYGLGWDSVDFYPFAQLGIKAVAKNGDVIISGSQIIILPEYNLVAAATCSGTSSNSCKQLLTYTLLSILKEAGIIDSVPERAELTESSDPVPEEIRKFEGTYLRSSGAFTISFTENTMIKTALPGGGKTTYNHIGNGHFTDNGTGDYWFYEQDGKQYHVSRTWSAESDLISLPSLNFLGNKVEESELSDEVKAAWRARKGKTYLLVSEPCDSFGYIYQTYGLAIPSCQLTISVDPDKSSFWRGMRITGENTAENAAEVPISGSTNITDAVFTVENGVEYLTFSNGLVYRCADGIETYDPEAVIASSELTRWYRADDDYTVQYDIPDGCAVAVYNKSLKIQSNSYVTGDDEIEPENGFYVAFIGNGEFKPAA